MCLTIIALELAAIKRKKVPFKAYKVVKFKKLSKLRKAKLYSPCYPNFTWKAGENKAVKPDRGYAIIDEETYTIGSGALHFFRTKKQARDFLEYTNCETVITVMVSPKDVIGANQHEIAATKCTLSKKEYDRAVKYGDREFKD